MSTQIQTTLLERVAVALEADKRVDEANAASRYQSECRMLTKALWNTFEIGEVEFEINDRVRPVALVEGLRFTFHSDEYGVTPVLLRECPHCHEEVHQRASHLEILGRAIEGDLGYPHRDAFCLQLKQKPQPETTAEARLLQALRDLIYESQEQGL